MPRHLLARIGIGNWPLGQGSLTAAAWAVALGVTLAPAAYSEAQGILLPSSTVVSAAAGQFGIYFNGPASGGTSLSLTPNAGFINSLVQTSAGPSGVGGVSIYIELSYSAFTGTGTRTGTLTVASPLVTLTFTLTQVGTNYSRVSEWGPPILSSGTINPGGVAVDNNGNIWIADFGDDQIKEFNASTQQVSTPVKQLAPAPGATGAYFPTGVAADSSGNIYWADEGDSYIKEVNAATGQVATVVSSGLSFPYDVAVDSSGNLYIADTGDNAIKEWNASTQQLTTLVSSGLKAPRGVAVDLLGNVYFSSSSPAAVEEWNPFTQQVTTLVPSGLYYPWGVAVDASGDVYFSDYSGVTVQEWNVATQQVGTLANASSGLGNPAGIAVDAAGNVWVADHGKSTIDEIPNAFVGPASFSEPATAGSDALLQIQPSTTPLNGAFAPTSDQSWLTIGAVTNGVVNFSFTANPTLALRVANIDILGQQIPVTQAFNSSLQSQTIAFGALSNVTDGVAPFTVTATANGLTPSLSTNTPSVCTVSAATVTVLAVGTCSITASQAGNGTYAAAAPVIQGFLVNPPGPVLGTSALVVGSAAGSNSVELTASGAWTASSGSSFLHIATGSASGTGNAVVIFTYDALAGTESRMGTLTIAGLALTVTQAGTSYLSPGRVISLVSSGLSAIEGVAVDTVGNVYIADTTHNEIQEWSVSTQQTAPLATSGLSAPSTVAVDAFGNVYIADQHDNAIKEWNPATQSLTTLASGLGQPFGVAVDGFENVYITAGAVIKRNAANEQVATLVSTIESPEGLV